MKITLNISYRTRWGESLYVSGSLPVLGGGDVHAAPRMEYLGGESWRLVFESGVPPCGFTYNYIVKPEQGPWRMEWGEPHLFVCAPEVRTAEVYDRWQDTPHDGPYYSSAFTQGMLHRPHRAEPLMPQAGSLCIRVQAPMIEPSQSLVMAGEGEALGDWDVKRAPRLSDARFPDWEVMLPLEGLTLPCEYKFVIIDTKTGNTVAWEMRGNRLLDPQSHTDEQAPDLIVETGMRFVNPLNPWRGAGTAIPVFSLRTADDFGVGDFTDLKKMIDWCALTGQKVLQLLPVNDTTMTGSWTDSYPYNANSTFALHPMYLHLPDVGELKSPERRDYFEALRRELNALSEVDYERVNAAKLEYLRELYAEVGTETCEGGDFRAFVARNEAWLRPYAAFCALRDMHGTPQMSHWGQWADYSPEKVDSLWADHKQEMLFTYFLQYHLNRQLHSVRDYAHSRGVILKGDIPIGISRTSVDAWVYPHLFHLNSQAGAPPDDFSIMGQNWGFPTYNWDEMSRDGFAWWKARFAKMSEYFDAYRIDHVLGFFRIWQIPMEALHGLLGTFQPALPYTPDELRTDYDFYINPDVHTRPLILEWMLSDFFGGNAHTAKELYLNHVGGDRYCLREEVDTQRKVADLFAALPKTLDNEQLCNGLLGLIDNVLFIEDPVQKGHYHPRIAAQTTHQYRCLNDYERWCFDKLYNDFFYHRHNDFWYGKAMWKLPALTRSNSMLCCAEDLGMIPDCVPAVMHNLQILSLEIQRMPKDPKVEFANTWTYPYLSVCTSSTHDMPGIRAWWESDHAMAQRYYNQVLHEGGEAPYYAEPWICSRIVELQLKSPSMLCILPLQDWLSTDGELRRENPADEQINIPAISRHYWRYRMHLTVEDLISRTSFNQRLADGIKESGR